MSDTDTKTAPGGDKLTAVAKVTSLHLFPIKSMGRMNAESLHCTDIGVCIPEHNLYDRYFMLTKGSGILVTAREYPRMAIIKPSVSEGKLKLDAPGMLTLTLPCKLEKTDSSVIHKTNVFGQNTYGIDCGQEANEWVSKYLGKPNMRLVFFEQAMQKRPAKGGFFGEVKIDVPEKAQLAYPDASPYMLMSEASVENLNTHLKKPVSVHNFRPNIVVQGCDANSEDTWDKVQIGSAIFKCVTHDPRCIFTTIDPETGVKDPDMEPLRTMRSYRPIGKFDAKSPMMGIFLILEQEGDIKVGDTVYASTKTPEWK